MKPKELLYELYAVIIIPFSGILYLPFIIVMAVFESLIDHPNKSVRCPELAMCNLSEFRDSYF